AAAEGLFEEWRAVNRDRVAIVLVEQTASEALGVAHRAHILVDGRTSRTGEARALAADPEIRRIFLGGGGKRAWALRGCNCCSTAPRPGPSRRGRRSGAPRSSQYYAFPTSRSPPTRPSARLPVTSRTCRSACRCFRRSWSPFLLQDASALRPTNSSSSRSAAPASLPRRSARSRSPLGSRTWCASRS